MTTLRRRRLPILAVTLAILVLLVGAPTGAGTAPPGPAAAVEVMGALPFPAMACIGCVGIGGAIALSGWGAVISAAASSGSAYAVFACASTCWRAITL